jgi:2'-5' RNA ligase
VSDERARLFVAVELPDEPRAALVSWSAGALRDLAGMRAVARESLHVTLCFLGWRAAVEIERIGDACAAAVEQADVPKAQFCLGGPVWLPARRPGVLAVAIDDEAGGLADLQTRIATALRAGGWYEPEARPFFAHVTVARVVKGARVRANRELAPPSPVRFPGSSVTLFRSRPGPGGARYEPLRTAPWASRH